MSDSSDVQKKACPEGMHSHPNNTKCHPIDMPHRPGSKAEKEHFDLGLDNSWYERHGTTRDEYQKEHADDTPKKEDVPKSDESSQMRTSVQWGMVKNIRERYPERTERIEKARDALERIKDDERIGHERFDEVMEIATGAERNSFLGEWEWKYFDGAPREVQNRLMESILDSMAMNPLLTGTFNRGLDISTLRDGTMMYYAPSFNRITVGAEELESLKDETDSNELKDPVTKEMTEWSMHFKNSDNISSIAHESGHAISYSSNVLNVVVRPDYTDEKQVRQMLDDAGVDKLSVFTSRENDVSQFELSISTYRIDESEVTEAMEELERAKSMLEARGYRLVKMEPEEFYGHKLPRYDIQLSGSMKKQKLDKAYEKFKNPWQGVDLEDLKQRRGEDYYKSVLDEIESAKKKTYDDFINEKLMTYGSPSECGQYSVDRLKECEALYKKLYGVKNIVPSDCYSMYGYYGEAIWFRTGDQASKKRLNAEVADERFAEAYNDVVVRGENANSMSKLLMAHSYYELAQLQEGYDGSFEDFVKENMGDSLKERIVKMSSVDKHQAFVMSVSKV